MLNVVCAGMRWPQLENKWAGIANSVACGVMLAASFDLLHEGAPYSPTLTICGMILGAVFIKWVTYSHSALHSTQTQYKKYVSNECTT